MPPATPAPSLDFDRHFRRSVWITLAIVFLVGGLVYSWKAQDDRSAFVRWRYQVLQLFQGENIYEKMAFPNPPIMPITLYPLMALPKVTGAVAWYFLKVGMTAISAWLVFRMVRREDAPLRSYIQGLVLLLSLRPILGDLHHGNINLLVLFLVVLTVYAWRNGKDVLSGLLLALAISLKVTPGLFLPYFAYKRQWRTLAASAVGLVLFLGVVPSAVLGPEFNGECLNSWYHQMISPYVTKAEVKGPAEINQSLSAVLTRLLSDVPPGPGRYDPKLQVNLVGWDPRAVGLLVKGVLVGMVLLLAGLCRTPTRDRMDPRLLGEFSLVVLTMLFASERSWKHHYVTLLLPYTFLVYRLWVTGWPLKTRLALAGAVGASCLMIMSTSTEVGGLFLGGQGHEVAQAYGLFCWAGMVLYIATAAFMVAERDRAPRGIAPGTGVEDGHAFPPRPHAWARPRAHLRSVARGGSTQA